MADKKIISPDGFMKALDVLYGKAIDGIPYVSCSLEDTIHDYLSHHHKTEDAVNSFFYLF